MSIPFEVLAGPVADLAQSISDPEPRVFWRAEVEIGGVTYGVSRYPDTETDWLVDSMVNARTGQVWFHREPGDRNQNHYDRILPEVAAALDELMTAGATR